MTNQSQNQSPFSKMSYDEYATMLKEHLPIQIREDLYLQARQTICTFITKFYEGRQSDPVEPVLDDCADYILRVLISCYYYGVKTERERIESLLGIHKQHPTKN